MPTPSPAPADPTAERRFVVDDDAAGLRLDRYLTVVLPDRSRSQLQRLIRGGHVRVGGHDARPGAAVRAGDVVTVALPQEAPATLEPEDLPLAVVYEDADLLVIDKPAGMVVHPGAGHAQGTLVNALLHHVPDLSTIGGERRPGIVHRLDKGTSGLMVVAKHDRVHAALARQFHDRQVVKEYVALLWGPIADGRRIESAIGRDPVRRKVMSTRAGRRGRPAVTRVVSARRVDGLTLVRILIGTGRTHQIRVHLASIGNPIVGDATYGGVRKRLPRNLEPLARLERPFLHAARLAFAHPGDGRALDFSSPLPEDLAAVLEELEI